METIKIFPASPKPQLSLPLSIFDVKWLTFTQTSWIFCYEVKGLSSNHFNEVILHNLKRSLSLTLDHFYILAGHIIWPSDSPRPFISYTSNDAVSLTVVQSSAPEIFTSIIGGDAFEASLARSCVPQLHSTDSEAQLLALKITLFPGQGFVVGLASHHGFMDGVSCSLFLKAWSFLCKCLSSSDSDAAPSLPSSLMPNLERAKDDDPDGLYDKILEGSTRTNPRSVKLPPSRVIDPSLIRRKFIFTREDADNVRRTVTSRYPNEERMHLSPVVLAFSLAIACQAQAKNMKKDIFVIFAGDYRAKLGLPIYENYFGNCVYGIGRMLEAEAAKSEGGVAVVAKSVSEMVTNLKKMNHYESLKTTIFSGKLGGPMHAIGLAGSPIFGFYKIDFGWGVPVMVYGLSIDGTENVALEDAREGDGSIQIEVVMEPHYLEEFSKLFVDALKAPLV